MRGQDIRGTRGRQKVGSGIARTLGSTVGHAGEIWERFGKDFLCHRIPTTKQLQFQKGWEISGVSRGSVLGIFPYLQPLLTSTFTLA